ncbi:flavin reductase (DIM6/NTAB) family NADH-FMN oxidoreductase RutF [Neolewinella xylanilytica]|uniref:Flavin reductase (DIM6/NTAB) family NADH-FMN oxidoreductase RutF n=1 Tax=Neolewinella xylanilytica TaxID=1514080 RepID=A0A2S6IBR0_9BACT|nr:flavin reductase family protein [Neolewinella xylanilytica]PPK88906.1 flavin reductase (DIM6/NTAB) family NADH-FMN oxidoreductase RutF [Neolewinella xylanilytica]
MTLDPAALPTKDLYGLLSTAVAPRPIACAATVDGAGRVNLSPFSYFNVFSTVPPILVFSPIRRGRDGSAKDTLANVQEVAEVTINVVNFDMVEQMSLASTEYEKGVNEFEKAGFTAVASEIVRPPRVGESPVSFECTVDQVVPLGEGGGAGNLVVARVVRIHLDEAMLDEAGVLDTVKLDLVARMGASYYCRATPASLFEIPKPLRNMGMGVDGLPEHIRFSEVLTGNNLGRLGNLERLPEAEQLRAVSSLSEVVAARAGGRNALHRLAQQYLERGETEKALAVLLLELDGSSPTGQ